MFNLSPFVQGTWEHCHIPLEPFLIRADALTTPVYPVEIEEPASNANQPSAGAIYVAPLAPRDNSIYEPSAYIKSTPNVPVVVYVICIT